jgi:Domain of unknown function (DUF3850)
MSNDRPCRPIAAPVTDHGVRPASTRGGAYVIAVIDERNEAMDHDLKCRPEHFRAIEKGAKTCELRLNDRPYNVGDTLYLREWEPLENSYTGASLHVIVTHILSGGVWLSPGYIAMSIQEKKIMTRNRRCLFCRKYISQSIKKQRYCDSSCKQAAYRQRAKKDKAQP